MAEEIAFENGRFSNIEGLVTLTVDQIILHTIVHHSSTSTNMPNFIEIEETLWMYIHTHIYTLVWTDRHLRPASLGQLCRRRRVNLIIQQ